MHTQAHERFQGLLFDDKVIGHPSFTHPEVVPNLYEFPFLLNTNKDILKNVGVVTKQLMDPIDFHSIFPHTSQWGPRPTFFKMSYFVFSRKGNSYRFGTTSG